MTRTEPRCRRVYGSFAHWSFDIARMIEKRRNYNLCVRALRSARAGS